MRGNRKRLCKTDEAKIELVFTRGNRVLVERTQSIELFNQLFEVFPEGLRESAGFYPKQAAYHLLKYVTTCFGKSIFPENFVDYLEMRVSRSTGKNQVRTYSRFIPDENGVIERRKQAMERFYAQKDRSLRRKIVTESDLLEKSLNPGLEEAVKKVGSGGIVIPHPSANYHLYNGSTVFFEVQGINIPNAINIALEKKNELALRLISIVYAIILRELSDSRYSNAVERGPGAYISIKDYHRDIHASGSFVVRDFNEICNAVFKLLLDGRYLTWYNCKMAAELYGLWDRDRLDSSFGEFSSNGEEIDEILRDVY